MQRIPVIANIYGYAVCLIAVVVFFAGTAGFIGGAFGAIHPTPFHPFITRNIRIEHGSRFGGMIWHGRPGMQPGAMPMHSGSTHPGIMPQPGRPTAAGHASMLANARYAAVRRMTIALAMLAIAGILFARHWRWLHSGTPS
ncbi:MAG: hypothetical protein HKL91_02285 [Candidatus Eremiobacteraeota bacterium]|uniref:Uncharacterized protein n=1 Tax=mine drainage metagenome TaxID=410659 RepID=E6PE73_9ZZZZ|nr:hypothetical protein [Candidatus Eremiobacteraeota bacterium]